jgi:radical SAM protein with 4Fe4S-binding SPASM domain
MVYTNGEFLIKNLGERPEFMDQLWLYAVSIDGDDEQHNRVRQGTDLKRIRENLRALSGRYRGHVLFWSTLREEQSLWVCFEEFLRMSQAGLVNHFFWHWEESRAPFEDFSAFSGRYEKELVRVMEVIAERLGRGELLSIVHINELIVYLILGLERGHTACGVELARNYDIVSGRLFACADLPAGDALGGIGPDGRLDIQESDLKSLVAYKKWLKCGECGIHPYCGGRCPVQVLAGSRQRALEYCQLMRLHIAVVQEYVPEILASLKKNSLSIQDVWDRSDCLTAYTDVVP